MKQDQIFFFRRKKKCEKKTNWDSRFRRFLIPRILGVNLVEDFPGVEEDLPDVIDVPLPFAESFLQVHLERVRIHGGVVDKVVEEQALEIQIDSPSFRNSDMPRSPNFKPDSPSFRNSDMPRSPNFKPN